MLLWLWYIAPIRTLAWELPYAVRAALKINERKEERKKGRKEGRKEKKRQIQFSDGTLTTAVTRVTAVTTLDP